MNTNEKPKNQGEGDYESARKFDEDEQNFVKSADVSDLARRAAPGSKEEAAKLKEAEEIGRSHAVGGSGVESWPKGKGKGKGQEQPAGKPESAKTEK